MDLKTKIIGPDKSSDEPTVVLSARKMIAHILDAALLLDLDGAIIHANRAAADLAGVPQRSLSGRHVADIAATEESARVRHLLRSCSAIGYLRDFQFTIGSGGEEQLLISMTASVVKDDERTPVCMLSLLHDVTDRKRIEGELKKANAELSKAVAELNRIQQNVIQHQRMIAIGNMISGISHDFNNALMPILGFSEHLVKTPESLENKEEALRLLSKIYESARDAAEMIQCLNISYSPDAGALENDIDIGTVVDNAVLFTRPKWKEEARSHGADIRIDVEGEAMPPVTGSRSQLTDMLINLIFNAADALPDGGVISISFRLERERIIIEVRDNGTGMTEDVRRQCLNPFFTTKGHKGSGMGLPMIFGCADRHGGKAEIFSEPGKGTSVVVHIPVHLRFAGEKKADKKIPEMRRLNALVIDDDAWSREVLEQYLVAGGHSVETADLGVEGIDRFRKGSFDILIIDRSLPDMTGDEVARIIKKDGNAQPIIMVSGYGGIMKGKGDHPYGIDMILGKPLSREELERAIVKVMKKKL